MLRVEADFHQEESHKLHQELSFPVQELVVNLWKSFPALPLVGLRHRNWRYLRTASLYETLVSLQAQGSRSNFDIGGTELNIRGGGHNTLFLTNSL